MIQGKAVREVVGVDLAAQHREPVRDIKGSGVFCSARLCLKKTSNWPTFTQYGYERCVRRNTAHLHYA